MIERRNEAEPDCIDCIFWSLKPNTKIFLRICRYGEFFPESNITDRIIENEETPDWCPRREEEKA